MVRIQRQRSAKRGDGLIPAPGVAVKCTQFGMFVGVDRVAGYYKFIKCNGFIQSVERPGQVGSIADNVGIGRLQLQCALQMGFTPLPGM